MTPLAVAALAMLVERPMHPYEMYQLMLQRKDDRLVKVRPGSLYHAIAKLEGEGLAEVVRTDREGRRPERTTYAVTESGRVALAERLTELLAEPADEYPSFPLALSQAHTLPSADVRNLLATRIDALRARLVAFEQTKTVLADKGVPERYWIDADYQRRVLAAELDWLERCILRIAEGDLEWDSPSS